MTINPDGRQSEGVTPSGSGYSAEPEPCSTVSAVPVSIPNAWEFFSDAAYFDMWCVRPVGCRNFGEGFHVVNERSARELGEYLNHVGGLING